MIRLSRIFPFICCSFFVALCLVLFLSFGSVAVADVRYGQNVCAGMFDDTEIDTVINYGNVEYKSVPRDVILKMDRLHNPKKTLGVTVAGARVSYDLDVEKKNVDGGVCVGIKKIKFFVGYPVLSVLIDEKYRVGSCQYDAIKRHEKGHVLIYQKELKYYGDLILADLRWMGERISPMFFRKNVSDESVRVKVDEFIAKSSVMAIMEKLDSTLKKQNAEYDSDAEYRRVRAECDEW